MFKKIDNTNLILQSLITLFQKKIIHLESKFNFDCYNMILFDIISDKLVNKPKHFDSFFFPNQDHYTLLIHNVLTAKKSIHLYTNKIFDDQLKSVLEELSQK